MECFLCKLRLIHVIMVMVISKMSLSSLLPFVCLKYLNQFSIYYGKCLYTHLNV